MAQFATADELATLLRRDFTADETAAADLLLDGLTGAIKRHTGQQIELVEDDVVKLQGTWGNALVLPQWPVVSVSAVKVNGTALPAGYWLLAGRTLYRGSFPVINSPDPNDLPTMAWLGPLATIEVTYTHGFEPIPDDVKLICLRAGARGFDNPEGLNSETAGSVSASSDTALLTDAEKAQLDALIPHT